MRAQPHGAVGMAQGRCHHGPPHRLVIGSSTSRRAYVTNRYDLLQDQFSVEMLLWTTWAGDPQADPSG